MTVRPARAADIAAVVEIDREAFVYDRLTARQLRRMLARGSCALLVAAIRGDVVGYALVLLPRGRRARLYGFAVRASARGRGVGARLLAAAETEAARRGHRAISLETDPRNHAAMKLYRRSGFEPVASLGSYYSDGTPAERWAKELAPAAPRRFLLAPRGAGPFKSRARAVGPGRTRAPHAIR